MNTGLVRESCFSGQVLWHLRQDGRLQHLSQLAEFQVHVPSEHLHKACGDLTEFLRSYLMYFCHVAPSISLSLEGHWLGKEQT